MKVKFPVRKVNIYQGADGSKIEEHCQELMIEREVEESVDVDLDNILYVGVLQVTIPEAGISHEIKFKIPAKTIEEAFDKFPEGAENILQQMQNQQHDIVTASEHDLDIINSMSNQKSSPGGIILN